MDIIKNEHKARRKKLKYIYPMLGIVEAFLFSDYVYLSEEFQRMFRVGMECIMEHYFCRHRLSIMHSVSSQEYGSWVQSGISQNMHFNI